MDQLRPVTLSTPDWDAPPFGAVMVTAVVDDTLCVFTVNVALLAPAATVTLDGTLATEVLLLDSVTVVPPDGAGPLSVTVPVEELPPWTVVGLRVSEASDTPEPDVAVGVGVAEAAGNVVGVAVAEGTVVGVAVAEVMGVDVEVAAGSTVAVGVKVGTPKGRTVSVADFVTPAPVTEIVTAVDVVTPWVLTSTRPVVDPCGTVTVVLVLATDGLLLERYRSVWVAAGAAIVTVPSELVSLVTEVGLSTNDVGGIWGVRVTDDWIVAPLRLTLIVTGVFVVTALVEIGTAADQAPDAIVTVAGTLATAALLLDTLTTSPPVGAAPFNCTSGCTTPPPVTGLVMVNDCSVGGTTVIVVEAEDDPSVAVTVTGVGELTAFAEYWN